MSSEKIQSQQGYDIFRRVLHLLAGGVGATAGQFVTCPLDVVQTRLQSTHLNFSNVSHFNTIIGNHSPMLQIHRPIFGITYFQILLNYIRYMVRTEGFKSLFKGLSPGLLGIVPAKATYFYCYANVKAKLIQSPRFNNHDHVIHTLSAVFAGTVTGTVTNPVWYIKTKLQLNRTTCSSILKVIRNGYEKHGLKCFFRGVSASYVGVLETVIYFLLYEDLKKTFNMNQRKFKGEKFHPTHLIAAALASKITATTIMYPHEVIRTRLRQDIKDNTGKIKYRTFFQALKTVAKEEGRVGLYGGFGTSLMRQLPNTAVTFLTYEAIIYFLDNYEN